MRLSWLKNMDMMKNKMVLRVTVIGIFFLLVTLLLVIETYALFETNTSVSGDIGIGQWKILLNGNDILQERVITLDDFVYENGSHTDDNYFAPGTRAYFDVVVDAHLSDVSVSYDLSVSNDKIATHPNIQISFKNMNTNAEIMGKKCNGVIRLGDNNRVVTLRVYLTWEDVSEYDELDTEFIGENLEFLINAKFEQYVGE